MKKSVIISLGILILLVILSLGSSEGLEASQHYEISSYRLELEVDQAGDFFIKEEITYDFQEGRFSKAYREVPGRGFSSLEFIGLEGEDTSTTITEVKEGSRLEVEWDYPARTEPATFNLQYVGRDGLISREGRNILDWQAVGTSWDVPIQQVEVIVSLPDVPEELSFEQGSQPGEISGSRLTFQTENLAAGEGWRLQFGFAEQVSMPEQERISDYSTMILALVILAGVFVTFRIITAVKAMRPGDIEQAQLEKLEDMSFINKVYFYDHAGHKSARVMAALIFTLAAQKLLKLRVETKNRLFGKDKPVMKVSLSTEKNPGQARPEFAELFKVIGPEAIKLEKVLRKTRLWSGIRKKLRKSEEIKAYLSQERKQLKRKSLVISIAVFLLAVIMFLDFIFNGRIVSMLPVIFFTIIAVGEFVRYILLSPLNDAALTLRKNLQEQMEERRERLLELAETEPQVALSSILRDLPWLLLDHKMSSSKFKKIRKKLTKNLSEEEAEAVDLPHWLVVEGMEGALKAIEVVEYTMTAVYAAVASTSSASAGSGGGGAGGGGGGAG
ncbi:MAG: DUF2207 domain-containing protein [Bacillota bacterium]